MRRCLRSLLYLCVGLAITCAQYPALGSGSRGRFPTARVIVAPRFICYPILIPSCDYSHPPPAIYNTPCGVWLPYW